MPGKGGRRGKYGKHLVRHLILPFPPFSRREEHARDALSTLLNYRFAPPSARPSARSFFRPVDDSRIRNGSLIYSIVTYVTTPRPLCLAQRVPFPSLPRFAHSFPRPRGALFDAGKRERALAETMADAIRFPCDSHAPDAWDTQQACQRSRTNEIRMAEESERHEGAGSRLKKRIPLQFS